MREAAAAAAMRWGVGAGASRLVSGNMTIHRRLEERLAEFKGAPRCVLFGSGYLANVGVVSALARKGDVVFSDELNHASLVDGCRLAGAQTFVYRHGDVEHLEWGLAEAEGRGSLIVTDGVFLDGRRRSDAARDRRACRRYDARVMVDEAACLALSAPVGVERSPQRGWRTRSTSGRHARQGARCLRGLRVRPGMARYLVNTARTLIFSTALPAGRRGRHGGARAPRAATAARGARAAQRGRDARGAGRGGLATAPSRTQILPLVIGDPEQVVTASRRALERGVFAQAIVLPRCRVEPLASGSPSWPRTASPSYGRPRAPSRAWYGP